MLEEQRINDNGEIVTVSKVDVAIERLRAFEPPEGYYLAFSGGKDSQCIYHLAKEAGVKFDAHYNITGVDPPELVYFMRKNYPNVEPHKYEKSMFRLIEKKGFPTRLMRFCCSHLKERGGKSRVCLTGVRWAESAMRKNNRKPFEVMTQKKRPDTLFNDNEEGRRMFENCTIKGKRLVNPIVDWKDEDVWEYIHSRKLEYCELYDQGWHRLGCIGCPMAGKGREREFELYPKIQQAYFRAGARFYEANKEKFKANYGWNNAQDYWDFWMEKSKRMEEFQGNLFEDDDDN